jgi:hypothetical protein
MSESVREAEGATDCERLPSTSAIRPAEGFGGAMRNHDLTSEPTKLGRIAAIDVARGLALIGMGVYHLIWDLAHFGFVESIMDFS